MSNPTILGYPVIEVDNLAARTNLDLELLDVVIEEHVKRIKAYTGKPHHGDLVIRWKLELSFFRELKRLVEE